MTEEIKILAVGFTHMTILSDEELGNLLNVRKFLESLPQYHEYSEMGGKLHEMADSIDSVYWLHRAYRHSYEKNKNYSLKMQEIIEECGGFVTFKEYIGMSFRISKKTHTSELENIDMDVFEQIAHDKKFPVNQDATWKSYRAIINYVMENYNMFDWDDVRTMYREYKLVIEGKWFP